MLNLFEKNALFKIVTFPKIRNLGLRKIWKVLENQKQKAWTKYKNTSLGSNRIKYSVLRKQFNYTIVLEKKINLLILLTSTGIIHNYYRLRSWNVNCRNESFSFFDVELAEPDVINAIFVILFPFIPLILTSDLNTILLT